MIPAELRVRIEAALADPDLPADLRAELRRWLSAIVPGDPTDVREQINRDLARVSAGHTARQAGSARARLAAQRQRLACQGGAGLATADEILDNGALGLRFFEMFLPLYGRCGEVPYFGTAVRMSVADLQARYDAERGLRLARFRADADRVTAARSRLEEVNDVLDDAGLQLASVWEGAAAREAIVYYRRFSQFADQLRHQIGTAGEAVAVAMTTVESVIFEKVRSVLSLYRETSGGFDASAVETVIGVALGAEHGWGELLAWFGESGRGESGRRLAQRTAQQWLQSVFKPDVELQVRLFLESCDWCRRGIREAFALAEVALASIPQNPFRTLPHRIDPGTRRTVATAPHRSHPGQVAGRVHPPGTARLDPGGGPGLAAADPAMPLAVAGHPRTFRPRPPVSHPNPVSAAPVGGVRPHHVTVPAPDDVTAVALPADAAGPWPDPPEVRHADAAGDPPASSALLAGAPVSDPATAGAAIPASAGAAIPASAGAAIPASAGAAIPATALTASPAAGPGTVRAAATWTTPTGEANASTTHDGTPAFALPLIPAGRSGAPEAHRKYRVPGDLVGADDLARWDELRPVLGEDIR